jgi:hypothetical protein
MQQLPVGLNHNRCRITSFAEPHHFYAATAPGKNFDVALALAPTLIYSKQNFLKQTKVNLRFGDTLSSEYCMIEMVINMNRKSFCGSAKHALASYSIL